MPNAARLELITCNAPGGPFCVEELETDPVEVPTDAEPRARELEDLRRAGDWRGVIERLIDDAERATSNRESVRILLEAARTYQEELSDLGGAFEATGVAFARDEACTDTLHELERLAEATGQWPETIDLVTAAAVRATAQGALHAPALWARLTAAHVRTGDLEAAATALERIDPGETTLIGECLDLLEEASDSVHACQRLRSLAARVEDWPRVVRILTRMLRAGGDAAVNAELHRELALASRALGDERAAEWHLSEVLRLVPAHRAGRDALLGLYRSQGAWRKYARVLEQRILDGEDPATRAEAAFAAANVYAEKLGDRRRAIGLYAGVMEAAPHHTGAALPLARWYLEQERWDDLVPLAELLVGRAHALGADAPSVVELRFWAAHASRMTGRFDRARRHYRAALAQDTGHLPSLLGYAALLSRLLEWDAAARAWADVLVIQRQTSAAPESIIGALCSMAEARYQAGDLTQAAVAYENVVAEVPGHVVALQALAQIHRQQGDFESALRVLRLQAERATEEGKLQLQLQIGALLGHELDQPLAAISAFRRVLELEPENRQALHELVQLYSAAEMWRSAFETIIRTAEIELHPLRRGKYYQAAATLAHHRLDRADDAVGYLNRALDCYFGDVTSLTEADRRPCLAAFEQLVTLLSELGAWKELARNYLRMIKRLRRDDPVVADLWHALGIVYRDQLGQLECAIRSFETAADVDRDRLTRHRILIDLYEQGGRDWVDKAIERRRRLIRAEPLEAEHYRALARLYHSTGRIDEAWCACRAMVFLRRATPEETRFFQEHRVRGYVRPPAPMTPAVWGAIRHPDEDPLVNAAFALIAAPIVYSVSPPLRKLSLHGSATPAAARLRALLAEIAAVLGVAPVESRVQPELDGEILIAHARRGRALLTLFALGRVAALESRSGVIVNAMTRTLALARPESYLRLVMPSRNALEAALTATVAVFHPGLASHAAASEVAWFRRAIMRGCSPSVLQRLAEIVRQLCAQDWRRDMEQWSAATDATARRAGLLISGDLETAMFGIAREPQVPTGPSMEAKATDLLLHSISQHHFAARRALGVTLRR